MRMLPQPIMMPQMTPSNERIPVMQQGTAVRSDIDIELDYWLSQRLTDAYRNDKSYKMYVDAKIAALMSKRGQ